MLITSEKITFTATSRLVFNKTTGHHSLAKYTHKNINHHRWDFVIKVPLPSSMEFKIILKYILKHLFKNKLLYFAPSYDRVINHNFHHKH